MNAASPNYFEASAWRTATSGPIPVNGQGMVTAPCRRYGVNANISAGTFQSPIPRMFDQIVQIGGNVNHPLVASDLMLTDVTDFEVKVLWDAPTPPSGPPPPWLSQPPDPTNNPDYPFDRLPVSNNSAFGTDRVFDTWSQRIPPTAGLDDYGSPIGSPLWNAGYGTGTAGPKTIPIKVRIRAIQIELRIWDVKSKQSRQITIIQDM
jgi:hypothetical protein